MTKAIAGISPFKSREERTAEREAKREALLRAAVQMFNERGFHSTSLDDVAATLGVSKPTVYHYLGNKEQVLLECVSRGIAELRDAAAEAGTSAGRGVDRLRSFLIKYAQINMDDFGRCVIRTAEEGLSGSGAQRFRGLKREIDTAMRQLIADAMADGSIRQREVKLTAFTLAGSLNWVARWYDKTGGADPEKVATEMVDLLLEGVGKAER
jgi:AcrR family transcriptional regulator